MAATSAVIDPARVDVLFQREVFRQFAGRARRLTPPG